MFAFAGLRRRCVNPDRENFRGIFPNRHVASLERRASATLYHHREFFLGDRAKFPDDAGVRRRNSAESCTRHAWYEACFAGRAKMIVVARISSIVLALMIALAPQITSAQTAPSPIQAPVQQPRAMTLPDAIAYARAHQPAARAAIARVRAAQTDAKIPRAQWLPFFEAGAELLGGTANNTTASYVGIPGLALARIGATKATGSGSMTPYASTLAAAGLFQEVFDFGRIAAESAVADSLVDIEKYGADAQWLLIELGVEEAFFAVQAAKSIMQASEDAYQRAKVHRDYAKAKVAAGLRPPIDLTRAEADLTRFDVARIRAQGGLHTAQSNFAAAVGVPEPQLDATGEAPPTAQLPSLSDAFRRAQEKDPLRLQALARLKTQEALTKSITALLRPNFALTASLSVREGGAPPSSGEASPNSGWLPDVANWDVGLVLRVPLFDGVVLARRDASRDREEVRRAEVDLVRQQQAAGIEQAYVGVGVAASALTALEHAVEAARANYNQADARFKGGLGTIVELADAEAVRTDAEIQLALGKFELARTRAILGRLIAEGL
jgi:outer membrane protein TolC